MASDTAVKDCADERSFEVNNDIDWSDVVPWMSVKQADARYNCDDNASHRDRDDDLKGQATPHGNKIKLRICDGRISGERELVTGDTKSGRSAILFCCQLLHTILAAA